MMMSVSWFCFRTLLKQGKAVQAGHADIRDDQMVVVFFKQGHGLETVLRLIDLPAVLFQSVVNGDPHDLIVFSEQYPWHLFYSIMVGVRPVTASIRNFPSVDLPPACTGYSATWRIMVKTDPWPGLLSTVIFPFIR